MNTLPSCNEVYKKYKETVVKNQEAAWQGVIQTIQKNVAEGIPYCTIYENQMRYLTQAHILELKQAGYRLTINPISRSLIIRWANDEEQISV